VKRIVKAITSFFYMGHSSFAPGTAGSLGGLIVYFLVNNNALLYGFVLMFLFTLGILFAGEAEKIYKRKDEPRIVIDEVCGMLLTLFFVPVSVYSVVLGFLLFRVMDVLKPFPAKRIEKLAGSVGIMFDDVVAGIYANLILQVMFRVVVRP